MGTYNENDHPRDSDGKFSTSEGAAMGRSRTNPDNMTPFQLAKAARTAHDAGDTVERDRLLAQAKETLSPWALATVEAYLP